MAKTLCKSVRKDGSPCQGPGLNQYDGLCLAHGPAPDQIHEWRSRGGQNSATAVRADKRIPQRLKNAIDLLEDGMVRVSQGLLSPAAYTAMCLGVKTKIEVFRFGDEDMEHVRTEENEAIAAEIAGLRVNLDILARADAIAAQLDQYRVESLANQGLAELTTEPKPTKPSQAVLTKEGRRRFGIVRGSGLTQSDIDDVTEEVKTYAYEEEDLPNALEELGHMEGIITNALADVTLEPAPPLDPLTGQPMTELPAPLKRSLVSDHRTLHFERSPEILTDQLRHIRELKHKVEAMHQDEHYSQKQSLVQQGRDPDSVEIDYDGDQRVIRPRTDSSWD